MQAVFLSDIGLCSPPSTIRRSTTELGQGTQSALFARAHEHGNTIIYLFNSVFIFENDTVATTMWFFFLDCIEKIDHA